MYGFVYRITRHNTGTYRQFFRSITHTINMFYEFNRTTILIILHISEYDIISVLANSEQPAMCNRRFACFHHVSVKIEWAVRHVLTIRAALMLASRVPSLGLGILRGQRRMGASSAHVRKAHVTRAADAQQPQPTFDYDVFVIGMINA